jgi:hypothetical protein
VSRLRSRVSGASYYEVRIPASPFFPLVLSRNEFCKFMAAGFSSLGRNHTHCITRENVSLVSLCLSQSDLVCLLLTVIVAPDHMQ